MFDSTNQLKIMPPTMLANLANAYITGKHTTPTYTELADFKGWIHTEWRKIPAPIKYTTADFTLGQAIKHFINSGELVISVAHNHHPHLTYSENAKFRAVHDWHHIIGSADDTLAGEIRTYLIARNSAPESIWWLLLSEIVLQAAATIYTGQFQPQKLVKVGG